MQSPCSLRFAHFGKYLNTMYARPIHEDETDHYYTHHNVIRKQPKIAGCTATGTLSSSQYHH